MPKTTRLAVAPDEKNLASTRAIKTGVASHTVRDTKTSRAASMHPIKAANARAAKAVAPAAISSVKTSRAASASSQAAKQSASTRAATTREPSQSAVENAAPQVISASAKTSQNEKQVASTRAAKKQAAVAKIAKLKVRAEVSWTQNADALAQGHSSSRTAFGKVAKRVCEYSLRRAPFCNADLLARLESNALVAVDITFVDDEEIAELNADYRGKPRPTDVLSFAQGEGEGNDGFFSAPDAPLMLGDIIVSVETALRQANELRHDARTEISFLVAHGTLHLVGYDHGKNAARRVMFALQDAIVEELCGAAAPAS